MRGNRAYGALGTKKPPNCKLMPEMSGCVRSLSPDSGRDIQRIESHLAFPQVVIASN